MSKFTTGSTSPHSQFQLLAHWLHWIRSSMECNTNQEQVTTSNSTLHGSSTGLRCKTQTVTMKTKPCLATRQTMLIPRSKCTCTNQLTTVTLQTKPPPSPWTSQSQTTWKTTAWRSALTPESSLSKSSLLRADSHSRLTIVNIVLLLASSFYHCQGLIVMLVRISSLQILMNHWPWTKTITTICSNSWHIQKHWFRGRASISFLWCLSWVFLSLALLLSIGWSSDTSPAKALKKTRFLPECWNE